MKMFMLSIILSISFFSPNIYAKTSDFYNLCANTVSLQSIEKKYNKTLAVAYLRVAESLSGTNKISSQVVGIDYSTISKPRLWYPCKYKKYIVIQLTRDALKNKTKKRTQLVQMQKVLVKRIMAPIMKPTRHTKKNTLQKQSTYNRHKAQPKRHINKRQIHETKPRMPQIHIQVSPTGGLHSGNW